MSGYLTPEQTSQLLRAINPKRVSKDGKGFSHVEAYDIRAHLSRIFGFGRWGTTVTSLDLVFEDSEVKQRKNSTDTYTAWTVCYRATVELTVCSPDGTVLATYGDGATGEATNQPSRGDAHDLAMKTALSQALKRCAVNLGDNFGLSLYAKGSTAALVRQSLVTPDAEPATDAVDAHITQQLPREDETPEPVVDPRVTNTPAAPPNTLVGAAGPEESAPPIPRSGVDSSPDKQKLADDIRERALGKLPEGYGPSPSRWIAHLMVEAGKASLMDVKVESRYSKSLVTLGAFLDDCVKHPPARDEDAA